MLLYTSMLAAICSLESLSSSQPKLPNMSGAEIVYKQGAMEEL